MVHLIDEEQQQGQHDHQQEAGAAGEEVHDFAEAGKPELKEAHNVALGDHPGVGDFIVVALGGEAADAIFLLDGEDPVGVEAVFLIDDGMEGDDVPLFQGGGVTFANDDQVPGPEGGGHGFGHDAQGSEARDAGNPAVVPGGKGGKGEKSSHQNHRPKDDAEKNTCYPFDCFHSWLPTFSLSVAAQDACRMFRESSKRFPFSSVPANRN